jgi:hypothetical protein
VNGRAKRALLVCLAVASGAPLFLSFASLAAWGRDALGLTEAQAWLVPLSLDGAAFASAIIVATAAAHGRGGGLARFMLWACTLGSAAANARHGAAVGGDAVALGLAPIFATGMLEVALRFFHREALEARGAVQPPLPRFGLVRWLRFPAETWAAWSAALRLGITSRADALAALEVPPPPVPEVVPEIAPPAEPPAAIAPPAPAPPIPPQPEPGDSPAGTPLGAMSKAAACRAAFEHNGDDDRDRARVFLGGHGVEVSDATLWRAQAQWRSARAQPLRAVE